MSDKMTSGWIKIDRNIIEWEFFKKPNTLKVWMYLLVSANIEKTVYQGKEIPRGSCHTTIKEIAAATGLKENPVRTELNTLLNAKQITKQKCRNFSIISIVSFDKYQGNSQNKSQNKPHNKRQNLFIDKNSNKNNGDKNNSVVTDYSATKKNGVSLPILKWEDGDE